MTDEGPPAVVVLGSANIDFIIRVERRPGPGETVLGNDVLSAPGGKGANQAVAAAKLGAHVSFVGAVGQDAHGDRVVSSLEDAGVETTYLARCASTATGVALITVTPDGENSIVVGAGANAHVGRAIMDRAADALGAATVLLMQMEIPSETIHQALGATNAGCRVVLNASPPSELSVEVLRICDPLVVNEHEAAFVLQTKGLRPEESVSELIALGVRSAVVTCGASGAFVATSNDMATGIGVRHVPAPIVVPVDTTGAGDAFLGALAWRLAVGDDLTSAVSMAVRVGSTAVLRRGAQPAYPSLDEVIPAKWSNEDRRSERPTLQESAHKS